MSPKNPDNNKAPNKFRVIFMGTPEFAAPGLKALLAEPAFQIVGVFTQTDKPVGRRQSLTPPPIKTLALQQGLPIFQPEKIKTATEIIKNLAPDLIVVIAYGQIIPPGILNIPRHGCLNAHASLLPKYRGAACLNSPILNGDLETGITIMQMDTGLDTGPILRQAKIKLSGRENLVALHDRLAELGAEILGPTILDFIQGKIKPQTQTEENASYVKTLKKEDGKIDWTRSAATIERMVRAYNPWPGSYALVGATEQNDAKKQTIKILAVEHEIQPINQHEAGKIFLHDKKLLIQCGQDSLIVEKLQLAGGRATEAAEFMRGHGNLIDKILK